MAWPNFFRVGCFVVLLCSICISVEASRFKISDLRALLGGKQKTPLSTTTTPAPFKFDFIVDQVTTPKPKRNPSRRRRCCRIGRMAARLGYTCYVKRNIALIRVNMPMRQKMKFAVKGDKWGYPFAKEMEFCAKTPKHTRKFNRCCDKEAREMDTTGSRR